MSKLKNDPGYRAGWCIHYRGITGLRGERVTSCEVGIEYETFSASGPNQPCFLTETGKSRPGAMSCAFLRRPTPEEIALHDEWLRARMDRFGTVMRGIAPWRKQWKGKSHSEVIECPACKGRLHLSISAYNSHVHGQCDTDGCVGWME